MRKIRIDEAQEGQVIAEDIIDLSRGSNFSLLMKRGVVLTHEYIEKLKKHGIVFLRVEAPTGYESSPGETYESDLVTGDIIFKGKVRITSTIPTNIKIEAGESVVINGDISPGCIVTSKKGGVYVRGAVRGTRDAPVKIVSFQQLSLHALPQQSVMFADMIAEGDINIAGGMSDSAVSCKGNLRVDGKAERSQLYSQSSIKILECGDEERKEACIVMVRPFECEELAQEQLKLDSRLSELAIEKQKLENVVELIKRLGKGISRLSEDKKISLADAAKRYRDIEGESASLQAENDRLKNEIDGLMGLRRIIVSGCIYPGVKVAVRNFSRVIMKKKCSVAFFVKDNKVDVSQI
jgi:uncharacterized protein (DUF342 family)